MLVRTLCVGDFWACVSETNSACKHDHGVAVRNFRGQPCVSWAPIVRSARARPSGPPLRRNRAGVYSQDNPCAVLPPISCSCAHTLYRPFPTEAGPHATLPRRRQRGSQGAAAQRSLAYFALHFRARRMSVLLQAAVDLCPSSAAFFGESPGAVAHNSHSALATPMALPPRVPPLIPRAPAPSALLLHPRRLHGRGVCSRESAALDLHAHAAWMGRAWAGGSTHRVPVARHAPTFLGPRHVASKHLQRTS